jgi:phosphodiesterase/alkaline phosphatase D-like protein
VSTDEETRKLYRSVTLGSSIEFLILDSRRGYLGSYQSKWLKHRLTHSKASWKIILSGTSFGRVDIVSDSNADVDTTSAGNGIIATSNNILSSFFRHNLN